MNWHTLPIKKVYELLGTSLLGLTSVHAKEHLAQYGILVELPQPQIRQIGLGIADDEVIDGVLSGIRASSHGRPGYRALGGIGGGHVGIGALTPQAGKVGKPPGIHLALHNPRIQTIHP